jgi:ribosomal protein L5
MKVIVGKTAEEATVENTVENVTATVNKKPKIARVGVKRGAGAAKQAATKVVSAPSRLVLVTGCLTVRFLLRG